MEEKSWLEMIAPGKGSHVMQKGGTFPGQKMERTIGRPMGSGDVIDWDGPEPEGAKKRDWSGWGKFPGAKYLGMPDEKKMESEHGNMPDMDHTMDTDENPSSADAAAPILAPDHEVMKEEMRKQHNPDQPVPPADQ
ncbi:MAG: hypothetical protein WBG28_02140, partial [Desulfobulbales bacterium]